MTQYRNLREGVALRLPDGMRDRLKSTAALNRRSMNAEIIFRLERDLENEKGAAETAISPRHDHNPSMQGNGNEYAD